MFVDRPGGAASRAPLPVRSARARDDRLRRPEGVEFIDTDFAAIARAFGCNGVRVEKPEQLAPAIASAAAAALLPTVIDVIVSRDESYRKIVAS